MKRYFIIVLIINIIFSVYTICSADTIEILINRATELYSAEEYADCEKIYEKVLEMTRIKYGYESSVMIERLLNMAKFYGLLKQYLKAENKYLEAIKISDKLYGKKSIESAYITWELAEIHISNEYFSQAEKCLRYTLNIYSDHPDQCSKEIQILKSRIKTFRADYEKKKKELAQIANNRRVYARNALISEDIQKIKNTVSETETSTELAKGTGENSLKKEVRFVDFTSDEYKVKEKLANELINSEIKRYKLNSVKENTAKEKAFNFWKDEFSHESVNSSIIIQCISKAVVETK